MQELIRQDYDAELHWALTFRCNLNCFYCFNHHLISLTRIKAALRLGILGIIKHFLLGFWNKKTLTPINVSALINSLERTKKIFNISFTGGEPFLVPNLIDACIAITKKHYISLITNLTTGNIKEFAKKINPKRVIYITASLHIKELERLNLLDTYIENFKLCQRKGFNIFAIEVAYLPILDEIEKYKTYFREKGIEIIFSPFQGYYNRKSYPMSYTPEELRIVGLNTLHLEKFKSRGKICNAGYNIAVVSPTGSIIPCYQRHSALGNIYEKIEFMNKLITCPFNFCRCPFNTSGSYLFSKALKDFCL
jgi:organic radical activating enzyme